MSTGEVVPYQQGPTGEELRLIDIRLRRKVGELRQVERKIQRMAQERALLEQMQTIDRMADSRSRTQIASSLLFRAAGAQPSSWVFIEGLPDPELFKEKAVAVLQERGGDIADVERKSGVELMEEEIHDILDKNAGVAGAQIELCFDRGGEGAFLHCAQLSCVSIPDAEAVMINLSGKWQLLDEDLVLHYIDIAVDPIIVVDGLDSHGLTDGAAVSSLMSRYGEVVGVEMDEKDAGRATVRYANISHLCVAFSCLHNRPPPGVTPTYSVEADMAGADAEGFGDAILAQLVRAGAPEEETRAALSVGAVEPAEGGRSAAQVEYGGSADRLLALTTQEAAPGEPVVVLVTPVGALSLQIPRRVRPIGPDERAHITELRDQYNLRKRKTEDLERSLKREQAVLERHNAQADMVVGQCDRMKDAVGWDEKRTFRVASTMDRPNKITHLLKELGQMGVEQAALRADTWQKTRALEGILDRLQRKQVIEERLAGLDEELRDKKLKHQEMGDDVRTMKRILWKKGKRAESIHSEDPSGDIKKLEGDKRVIQYEIQTATEERRRRDKTIAAQHTRLTDLEQRIATIAREAPRGLRELRGDGAGLDRDRDAEKAASAAAGAGVAEEEAQRVVEGLAPHERERAQEAAGGRWHHASWRDRLAFCEDTVGAELVENGAYGVPPQYKYRPEGWQPGGGGAAPGGEDGWHPPADEGYADSTAYEQLQKSLNRSRRQLQDKDQQMMEKDACIEALEKKVEILHHHKRTNMVRVRQDQKQLNQQHAMFTAFKAQQEQEAEDQKQKLIQEQQRLQEKIQRFKDHGPAGEENSGSR